MKSILISFLMFGFITASITNTGHANSCDDYCTPIGANLRYLYNTPVCMMILECDPACGRPIADLPWTRKTYYCGFRKFDPPDNVECMSKKECAVDESVITSTSDIESLTRSPRRPPISYKNKSNSSGSNR